MNMFQQQKPGDKELLPCCHQLHACYSTCGYPKKKCDAEFEASVAFRQNQIRSDRQSRKSFVPHSTD